MVQALVNSLNIDAKSDVKRMTPETTNFQQLFEKQNITEKKNVTKGTLGELKSTVNSTINEFKNLLSEVTQEIINENSLNLTLNQEVEEETTQDLDNTSQLQIKEEISDAQENVTVEHTETTENIDNPQDLQNIEQAPLVLTPLLSNLSNSDFTENNTDNYDYCNNEVSIINNNYINNEPLNNTYTSLTEINNQANTSVTNTTKQKIEIEDNISINDIIDEEMLDELKIESISADDTSSQEDIMQNQTPEEQGIKVMLQSTENFNLKENVNTESVNNVNALQQQKTNITEAAPSKIIEQVTKQMEGMTNGSKVNIILNPASLGKISVQLINTNEGLSAQFTVSSQEARELLMKGLDSLKDSLASQGVNIDSVTVKLNESQESENNSNWTDKEGSRGGNKQQNPNKEQRDKKQFEQTMSYVEENNG